MAKIRYFIRSHRWLRIIACLLLLLVAVFIACRLFSGVAAEKVFPDLAQPEETEAPSTFTTFRSSLVTEAIIGGQGTGLNCSIPKMMEKVAFKPAADGSDISLRFRQACVMHDLCYRHGYATYGYTQDDCDSQLQQSAYRLCRQINRQGNTQDPLSAYTGCEHEAKEVLLGVTLGGAGSFHSRRSSTYFEYDPQPARADDYIVGRAVPEDSVSDAGKDFGIRTFYFRRNTVKMRILATPPESSSVKAVSFPDALVATPPILTGQAAGAGLPSLVSLARNSFTETSVHLIPFAITRQDAAPKAGYLLTLPNCPGTSDACTLDADASINKFAMIDGKPTLISLTHRGVLGRNKTTVKIEQNVFLQGESRTPMSDYALNGPQTSIHNQYRFLSHDMLFERDNRGEVTHALAFARGVAVAPDGTRFIRDDSGKDYATRLTVARQKLGNSQAGSLQRFSLNAAETDEPLSVVRLGKEQGTGLMGLAWSAEDLRLVENGKPAEHPPLVKLWRLPQDGAKPNPDPQTLSIPVPVPNGYISLPPIVAYISTQDAPLMILTRVAPDRWQNQSGQNATTVKTDTLAIDFFITSLVSPAAGSSYFADSYQLRCEISLDKQLQSPEAGSLRQRAYRTLYGRYNSQLEAQNPAWQLNLVKSDLAQRWRMSQVIVSERQLKEGPAMALTMVFNGFPAMSFQALLKAENGQLRYLPLDTLPRFINHCSLKALPAEANKKGQR
ncbi:hypothetical protein [Kalamiella sp. sgz302252]|uniref:hypothetical protein n=1 Tax=Pantoea sp. sgz302252 TaxID=3341827 RepID=UPI0036D341A9